MARLKQNKNILIGTAFLVVLAALAIGQLVLVDTTTAAPDTMQVPTFEVDPLWPKPLPNHWVMGSTIGVTVDSRDHVFIIHRQGSLNARTEVGAAQDPPSGECCVPAPPVLEFDPDGNLVGHWGGPGDGYDWPESNHGITIDPKDNIWIGGNGGDDAHILKFTRDGKFLKQFGKPGARRASGLHREGARSSSADSHDKKNFGRVAKISFDAAANEAYVADGYLNKRVAVLDIDTGAFKRYWGAYGNEPDDAEPRPLQPRRAARAAVPQSGALRRAVARRSALRLRSSQRPDSGLPEGRQRS